MVAKNVHRPKEKDRSDNSRGVRILPGSHLGAADSNREEPNESRRVFTINTMVSRDMRVPVLSVPVRSILPVIAANVKQIVTPELLWASEVVAIAGSRIDTRAVSQYYACFTLGSGSSVGRAVD